MARLNLVKFPSFRQGTTGWVPLNGSTIAVDSGYAFYGAESLKVIKSAVVSSGVQTEKPIPVIAFNSYAASAYVRVPITVPAQQNATIVLTLTWLDAAGVTISEVSSPVSTVTPQMGWFRVTRIAAAPTGAVSVLLSVSQLLVGTAGQVFYVDAVLMEQSNFVGGYLDNITPAERQRLANTALTPVPVKAYGDLQLNADVILNDLVLNTIDENDTLWVCTDIDGWWGNSAPEIPDIPRGVEDGSYNVSGRYTARQIELRGVFIPQSPNDLSEARDRLVRAVNIVRQGAWLRTNESPTKAAYVRLSGRPTINTVNARGRTEFSVGLRAVDPIKYEWNDADPEGKTRKTLKASDGLVAVSNIGTANVSAQFTITGPLGRGSTVYNSATDETITLIQPLRGAGAITGAINRSVFDNVATISTTLPLELLEGDEITLAGFGPPFDTVNKTVLVKTVSVTPTATYGQFTFDLVSDNVEGLRGVPATLPVVSLVKPDILTIDTYDHNLTFNSTIPGSRARVETLVDWIRIAPGDNTLAFLDDADFVNVNVKAVKNNQARFTTAQPHYFIPGEQVTVSLPVTAELTRKSLTNNIATLATKKAHGFDVGDTITVATVERSDVVTKALSSNVATLTTLFDSGIASGDSITVTLPTQAKPVSKRVVSNVATINTDNDHLFSTGDTVTVNLPTSANISAKSRTAGLVTLTTPTAHNFAVNDQVTVSLPVNSTAVAKALSGPSVVITTSSAHGYSVGDSVQISLPSSATLASAHSASGNPDKTLTFNTTSAHNFVVGDRVTVNLNITTSLTVTNRSATSTACTLTLSANHQYVVGEQINVTGVGTRYNISNAPITAVTSNTVTYNLSGATESSTSSSGSVYDRTIGDGYNGTKAIDSVPSSTSFTVFYGDQTTASSSTQLGSSPTLVNVSNSQINGTKTITAVNASMQFSYDR